MILPYKNGCAKCMWGCGIEAPYGTQDFLFMREDEQYQSL